MGWHNAHLVFLDTHFWTEKFDGELAITLLTLQAFFQGEGEDYPACPSASHCLRLNPEIVRLLMSMQVDRINQQRIFWSGNYLNPNSREYQTLESEATYAVSMQRKAFLFYGRNLECRKKGENMNTFLWTTPCRSTRPWHWRPWTRCTSPTRSTASSPWTARWLSTSRCSCSPTSTRGRPSSSATSRRASSKWYRSGIGQDRCRISSKSLPNLILLFTNLFHKNDRLTSDLLFLLTHIYSASNHIPLQHCFWTLFNWVATSLPLCRVCQFSPVTEATVVLAVLQVFEELESVKWSHEQCSGSWIKVPSLRTSYFNVCVLFFF